MCPRCITSEMAYREQQEKLKEKAMQDQRDRVVQARALKAFVSASTLAARASVPRQKAEHARRSYTYSTGRASTMGRDESPTLTFVNFNEDCGPGRLADFTLLTPPADDGSPGAAIAAETGNVADAKARLAALEKESKDLKTKIAGMLLLVEQEKAELAVLEGKRDPSIFSSEPKITMGLVCLEMANVTDITPYQYGRLYVKGLRLVSTNVAYTILDHGPSGIRYIGFPSDSDEHGGFFVWQPEYDSHRPVVFCGHGAGGALATKAAIDMLKKNITADVMCVTTGSPLVSTEIVAPSRFHHFVFRHDPVPRRSFLDPTSLLKIFGTYHLMSVQGERHMASDDPGEVEGDW